jgi:K+-sensing histidine kinase KdpD
MGLGMGLAIRRSIVQVHGGRLWATANPDGGETFQFPLYATNKPLPGRPEARASAAVPRRFESSEAGRA